jgi:peptide/nickel transport system ATP-binding protein
MTVPPDAPVLEVRNLTVEYPSVPHPLRPVNGVSFTLAPGECVALVGPSGSGKSTTALALLGLVPPPGRVTAGDVVLEGRPLAPNDEAAWDAVRGRRIALVPQEPLAALTPVRRVGDQIAEAARALLGLGRRDAMARALEALANVGLESPALRARQLPHEMSGGQRQRVLLAMALLANPAVLVADEPTSALDVLTAHDMMRRLDAARRSGLAVLLLSHDRRLVDAHASRVVTLAAATAAPHPTRRGSGPSSSSGSVMPTATSAPALSAQHITVRYPAPRAPLGDGARPAVHAVSFSVAGGECLAIVGESGAGKSSLVRAVLRLGPLTAGTVRVETHDFGSLQARALRAARPQMQPVFQDPGTSLHPWRTVRDTLDEGLRVRGVSSTQARRAESDALLASVGLDPALGERLPRALSGGQRQRVAIARALATNPTVVVCDEPVSALDDASRAQVLAVLDALRRERGLAVVCVAHDLTMVRTFADRVLVMYGGCAVETAPPDLLFSAPRHPYTAALAAVASGRQPLPMAHVADAPATDGCVFFARCPHPAKDARCRTEAPTLEPASAHHAVACHHPPLSVP